MEVRPIEASIVPSAEPVIREPSADLRKIGGVVRRCWKLAAAGAALALLLALAFVALVQPWYQSTVRILLDQTPNQLLTSRQDSEARSSTSTMEDYVATQMAVIGSDIVARRVVEDLKLGYDPASERLFVRGGADKAARVSSGSQDTDVADVQIDPAVVYAVMKEMSVYQVEKSMVIEIAVNDPDPDLAQKLAAAYGRAYLDDQLNARYAAARNAGNWLENRLSRLRDQSLGANAEVEKFRAANNLVSTDGRLVSDQQLQQLNDQLNNARSNVTRTAARVSVFEEAVNRSDVDAVLGLVATMPDIPETAPIRLLRADYQQAADRAREVAARWGDENDQAKALRGEVGRLSGLVLAEARRILDGFRGDFRVAKSEAESIQQSVSTATGQSQTDNATLVTLRNLEQRSASYNALYQDYLARYQEAVQQQTLSMTTGRLISKPERASLPTFPKTKIVLALSLFLGGALGGAVGVGRELLDHSFRARGDVEDAGVAFLGYVAAESRSRLRGPDAGSAKKSRKDALALVGSSTRLSAVLGRVLIAVGMRRRERSKVVGVLSLEPSAARSRFAFALAEREAKAGRRVLLIDGDARSRVLSRALAADTTTSHADVIRRSAPVETAMVRLAGGAAFLPVHAGADIEETLDLVAPNFIGDLRERFDLVVVDLPPAGPISEARALVTVFDAYVCTLAWGRTPRGLLRKLLQSSPMVEAKLVGAVLVDVPPRPLGLYDREGAKDLRSHAAAA